MSQYRRHFTGALAFAAMLTACSNGRDSLGPQANDPAATTPLFTVSSGSTPTVLGRGTFGDAAEPPLKVKRITGDWHVEIKAKGGLDLAVQSIVFQPGGQSGWHSHPGPVFIQIVSGTMTFYESDDPSCTPLVRTTGQTYLDLGDRAHLARNESGAPAKTVVTYFAPPGAPLRIDEPMPGNCAF